MGNFLFQHLVTVVIAEMDRYSFSAKILLRLASSDQSYEGTKIMTLE